MYVEPFLRVNVLDGERMDLHPHVDCTDQTCSHVHTAKEHKNNDFNSSADDQVCIYPHTELLFIVQFPFPFVVYINNRSFHHRKIAVWMQR